MPPIFLHQHIIDNQSGKTLYDVVDGMQRLSAIMFLNNEIAVPENFSEDGFGDKCLEGLFFTDFDKPENSDWKNYYGSMKSLINT